MSKTQNKADFGSARFKLNRRDGKKLVISFALSAGAALLIVLAETAQLIDWTSASWGPYLFAIGPFLLNFVRKLLKDSRAPWQKAQDKRSKDLGFNVS